jgi:phosphomannomutase
MTRFLFDIDGTLTDTHQKIDNDFEKFMFDFSSVNKVAFVTSNEREKTVAQLGNDLMWSADYSFNCSGNEIWQKDTLIHKYEWEPPASLTLFLEELLNETKFSRTTIWVKHLHRRSGLLNFSIAGNNCSQEDRNEYIKYDKSVSERAMFRDRIINKFPEFDVFIAGDTGLDICPIGKGKDQVVNYLKQIENEKTYYFGDQIFPGGNDYKIAMRCDHSYKVRSWRDTYETLAFLREAGYCE